jgi:nitrogen fixation NifU-like protein
MLDDLRELYQEVILDHGKNPRNFGKPDEVSHHANGHNPLCGDRISVYLEVDSDGVVRNAAFDGRGCAISQASASLMTEIVSGKTLEQVEQLFRNFHEMCTSDAKIEVDEDLADEMDRLQVMSGVRQYPIRVKCATLAWHTMNSALEGDGEATTE